jgi:hypothetical protein
MLNIDSPAAHWVYFILAVAGSIWYGITAYKVFDVQPVDPCGSVKRIHQFWFNTFGAAVGWLAGWVVLFRWLSRSATDEPSAWMILVAVVAFVGITGHLPLALQSLREWSLKHRKPESLKAADPPPVPPQHANARVGTETTGLIPDETSRYTFWLAIATWVIAGAGLLTFIAALLQWSVMRGQLTDTHNLAQSAELEQRAWLGTSDYMYTITESSPVKSLAIGLNTGKTPAMEIFCKITGITKPKGYVLSDADIVYPDDLPTLKQGTIFPNQHFPLTAGGPQMEPGKQKTWFENVKAGEWVQYFFGEIRYRDVFHQDHWTHFCTQYVPDTESGTPCPIYNDTDDDKKQ